MSNSLKALADTFKTISEGVRHNFFHPENGNIIASQPEKWGKTSSAVKSMQTAAKNIGKPVIVKDCGGKHIANIHPDGWHDLNEETISEQTLESGRVFRDGVPHKVWKDPNGGFVVKNTKTGEEHRAPSIDGFEKYGYSSLNTEERVNKSVESDFDEHLSENHIGFAALANKVGPKVAAYIGNKKYGKKKMEHAAETGKALTDSEKLKNEETESADGVLRESIKSAIALKIIKARLMSEGFIETNTVVTNNNSGVYFFNEETQENVVIRGGAVHSIN